MQILGIEIDNLSQAAIREKIRCFLEEPVFHRIATINPEFLLRAEKDPAFKHSLEQADLRLADGVGITLAFFLAGQKLVSRYPGADLMEEVLKMAEQKNLGVFLAVRRDGLSTYEEVKKVLLQKFPRLEIHGENMDMNKIFDLRLKILESNIQYLKSKIIFCNFGIPYQELFLAELKKNPGNVRLAIGVGGSFDYLTGKLSRAPKIVRTLGLEWLWRFFLQPLKRSRRVFGSVIIFPFKVFWQKK